MTSDTQDDSPPVTDGGATEQAIDWARPDPVSSTVVEAAVDRTGTDAVSLPPLEEYIDGDALNRLFAGDTEGRLSFEYAGLSVVVSTVDDVTVR